MSKKQTKTREQELKGTSVYREGLVCTKRKGETWKEADERNDYFREEGIKEGRLSSLRDVLNLFSSTIWRTVPPTCKQMDEFGHWLEKKIIEEQKIKGDEKWKKDVN